MVIAQGLHGRGKHVIVGDIFLPRKISFCYTRAVFIPHWVPLTLASRLSPATDRRREPLHVPCLLHRERPDTARAKGRKNREREMTVLYSWPHLLGKQVHLGRSQCGNGRVRVLHGNAVNFKVGRSRKGPNKYHNSRVIAAGDKTQKHGPRMLS